MFLAGCMAFCLTLFEAFSCGFFIGLALSNLPSLMSSNAAFGAGCRIAPITVTHKISHVFI